MDKYEVMVYPRVYRDIDDIYAYIALEKLAPENASCIVTERDVEHGFCCKLNR